MNDLSKVELVWFNKTTAEYGNLYSYSVINKDGKVISWGNQNQGGDNSLVSSDLNNVSEIFSNSVAFAALKEDGSVITWGLDEAGGDSSLVADSISSDVINIYSSEVSFLAVKKDGSIVTWGLNDGGGDSSEIDVSAGIQQIISASTSYAILLKDGSVVTWGQPSLLVDFDNGNDIPIDPKKSQNDIKQIVSSNYAFAALKNDGSVFTWGGEKTGGNNSSVSEKLNSGVVLIHSTGSNFAALKEDGTFLIWDGEDENYEYKIEESYEDIEKIISSGFAYSILFKNGSVKSFGDKDLGGDLYDSYSGIPGDNDVNSGVIDVIGSNWGFAALKEDGSVVTWGYNSNRATDGSTNISSGVIEIYANKGAYAALKENGSVVTWGFNGYGEDSSSVKEFLSFNVREIYSNEESFAALKDAGYQPLGNFDPSVQNTEDGFVVTWGNSLGGGDSSQVSDLLSKNIQSFSDIRYNFQIDPSRPNISGPSGKKNQDFESVLVEEDKFTIFNFTADESVTWSIAGGADSSKFSIDKEGLLIFNFSPDFESPEDSDTDNKYEVIINATDVTEKITTQTIIVEIDNIVDTGLVISRINSDYSPDPKGFSSISGTAPVSVLSYEIGQETILDSIKDYDGNLHAGDVLNTTPISYNYQGLLDVNGDNFFDAIFTNKISKRWVTARIDSRTGQVDFDDYGTGGGTRVVGIYEDPLIAIGDTNGGFLLDGVSLAPANFGASDAERYVDLDGNGLFGPGEDRLALNSQVRFQNDLAIENLQVKHSGDYDSDGIHEVYWKTNDGTAYLRALMHDDGNIRYANYQSAIQMENYLTTQGHESVVEDIV